MFGQLFDNEWSDAFDSLKKAVENSGGDGKHSIQSGRGKKAECTETDKDRTNPERGGTNSSVGGDKPKEGGAKSKVGGASEKDNASSKSSVMGTKSKTLGATVQKEGLKLTEGSKSLKSSTQEWKMTLNKEDSEKTKSRTVNAGPPKGGVLLSGEKTNAPKEHANKSNATKDDLPSIATTNAATDSVKSTNAAEAVSLLGEDVTDGGQNEDGGREMWGGVKGGEGAIAAVGEGEEALVAVGEGAGAIEEGEESEEEEEEDFHVEQLTILQNIVMVRTNS